MTPTLPPRRPELQPVRAHRRLLSEVHRPGRETLGERSISRREAQSLAGIELEMTVIPFVPAAAKRAARQDKCARVARPLFREIKDKSAYRDRESRNPRLERRPRSALFDRGMIPANVHGDSSGVALSH